MICRDLPQPIMLESSDKTFSVQLRKKIPLAYSNNKQFSNINTVCQEKSYVKLISFHLTKKQQSF